MGLAKLTRLIPSFLMFLMFLERKIIQEESLLRVSRQSFDRGETLNGLSLSELSDGISEVWPLGRIIQHG